MPIGGVVFDLDGTLVSQELDFEAIRSEIGAPTGTPLLEYLSHLPPAAAARAWEILERHEKDGADRARLLDGVGEVLRHLQDQGIRRAVLSRNSRQSVLTVLDRLQLAFDPIVTRDDAPAKPDPGGIHLICNAWQLPPQEILMVGDYVYDIQAGRAAGARTALITHGKDWPFASLADLAFPSFQELPAFWEDWLKS